MTGGSDDARPPKDGQGAIDDAWDVLIDEAGTEGDRVRPVVRSSSGPHGAVGKDRLAEPDDEMARLMSGPIAAAEDPKPVKPTRPRVFTPPPAKSTSSPGLKRTTKAAGASTESALPTSDSSDAPTAKSEAAATPSGSKEAAVVATPRPDSEEAAVIATSNAEAPADRATSTSKEAPNAAPKREERSAAEGPRQPDQPAGSSTRRSSPSDPSAGSSTRRPSQSDPPAGSSTRRPSQSDPPAGSSMGRPSQSDPPVGSSSAASKRPALRVVGEGFEPADDRPEPSESSESSELRSARASRPLERPAEPSSPAPESSGGLPWAWIGVGALVLGAVGFFALRDDGSATRGGSDPPVAIASTEPPTPSPARREPSTGPTDEPRTDTGPAPSEDPSETGEPASSPVARSDDPREPPPGTPPEIAAVFRRLPVSPSDGPPIGGIGANGIHIDELRMGGESGNCGGKTDDFSVSGRDRVGVCVRVVHPREKDELSVLWEKHGGSTRRSKMVVLAKHAYRTRGYLKLRKEYIGDWTVRILSSDGVELARHEFTVVP